MATETGYQQIRTLAGTGQNGVLSLDLDVFGVCEVSWAIWSEVLDVAFFGSMSAHLDSVAENSFALTQDDTFNVLPLNTDGATGGSFVANQKEGQPLTFRIAEDFGSSATAQYGYRVVVKSF